MLLQFCNLIKKGHLKVCISPMADPPHFTGSNNFGSLVKLFAHSFQITRNCDPKIVSLLVH